MSIDDSSIVIGYDDNVSSSTLLIYDCIPFDSESINAIPIIPIEPANDVKNVLPFLVIKLFKLKCTAVANFIDAFPDFCFLVLALSRSFFVAVYGFESSVTFPSNNLIILDEYFSANSGLCVTIIINLSFEISFNISITCSLVFESNAPVGSSANKMSGSFTNALAIATLCICPPDIWFGFLFIWSPNPTFVNASIALFLLSSFPTPDIVRANSTFANTV